MKQNIRHIYVLMVLLIGASFGSINASAQVPRTISYQGVLEENGMAARGNHTLLVSIWTAASRGDSLWGEIDSISLDTCGTFNLLLGANKTNPFDFSYDNSLWLETIIDGKSILPRSPLTAAPYALWADTANFASTALTSVNTPITGNGLSSNPISISQASANTGGYISSTDWNAFYGKLSSVAVSSPLTGAGVSANPISIPVANGTTNGYLSSTDWNNFNTKLSSVVVSAPLSGSGTSDSPLSIASLAGSYIQNGTSQQVSANFNIAGNGQVGGTFTAVGNINTLSGTYQVGSSTVLANPGTQNIFIGVGAGVNPNNSGHANIFAGFNAGNSNSSGYDNTFSGMGAGYNNSSGYNNTYSGEGAGYDNTTGYDNTFSGSQAGYQNGVGGNNNTFSGYDAGYTNTTGAANTALGSNADMGSASLTNATAIGFNAKVNASNAVVLGNTFVTSIGGYANWSNLSDGRFKKNVKNNVPGLEFINLLNPITYNLDIRGLNRHIDVNSSHAEEPSIQNKERIVYSGFIAQDVETAANSIGYNFDGVGKPENDKGHYTLSYASFVPSLVKAVQEMNSTIISQEKIISDLARRVEALESKKSSQ